MISHGAHERPINVSAAVDRLKAHATVEGFHISLESVGDILKTWTCRVADRQGQSAVGRGKGIDNQAVASAIAEALEHYRYTFEDTASQIKRLEFHFSTDHPLAKASPNFLLIFGDKITSFDCLLFEPFSEDCNQPIWFPAILQNPGYQSVGYTEQEVVRRSKIFRYATNSGTSAGLTIEDAWLHGLLEAIERDANGLALLRSVIARSPEPVRRINLMTLPAALRHLVALVNAESGALTVHLWDITSDTGVATLLCGLTIQTQSGYYRYFGSGTSLNPSYATERALLEALQGFHIHQRLGDFEQSPLPDKGIKAMSLYRRCEMDAGLFEFRGGEEVVEFETLPVVDTMGISEQVTFLVDRLRTIGCEPYRRTIHASEAVSIVQVLVPSFERFYLVERGIAVAPSWRGRRLLTSAP